MNIPATSAFSVSTHAPHARCDILIICGKLCIEKFLLTHLMRGATVCHQLSDTYSQFLLTHLMRGATYRINHQNLLQFVSTHAPHARCDSTVDKDGEQNEVSTHAPHARCDFFCFFFTIHFSVSTHAPHARCD